MIVSTARLALPRSAGAVTRTLSVSPSHPAMQFREDAGTTLIGNLIVVLHRLRNSILENRS